MRDKTYGDIEFVGYWEVGGPAGVQVSLVKKPIWFHRVMVRLVFGVVWKNGSPFS